MNPEADDLNSRERDEILKLRMHGFWKDDRENVILDSMGNPRVDILADGKKFKWKIVLCGGYVEHPSKESLPTLKDAKSDAWDFLSRRYIELSSLPPGG